MISQFVSNVAWGELDYLIIDTPPGTSDEHLAIVESLASHPNVRAVIVTTPQALTVLWEYFSYNTLARGHQ